MEEKNKKKSERIMYNPTFQKVVELYNETNLNAVEMANEIGVSRKLVSDYVKRGRELGVIEEKDELKRKPKFQTAVRLYDEGELKMTEIAEQVGISMACLVNYVNKAKDLGLIKQKRKEKSKYENPKFNKVIELYKQEEYLTYEEISKQVGVSLSKVQRYIKEAIDQGLVEKRKIKHKRWKKSKFDRVIELYQQEEHLTYREIANMLGITVGAVCKHVNKAIDLGLVEKRKYKRKAKKETKFKETVLGKFTEQIKGYIKAKDYKTAIKLMDNFSGYFQDASEEEIMQAKKEIKEELDRARSSCVGEETQNNGKDVAETR